MAICKSRWSHAPLALLRSVTVVALGFSRPQPAYANPASSRWFVLRIDPCVPVRAAAVTRQVGLELGRQHDRPPPEIAPVALLVSCNDEQIFLRASSPTSGKILSRTVDLRAQAAELRVRLLSLSIAELLRVSAGLDAPPDVSVESPHEAEPPVAASSDPGEPARSTQQPAPSMEVHAAAVAPSSPATPAPAVVPQSPPRFKALRLMALATGQVFFGRNLFLYGGGAALGWDSAHHIGLVVDLLARHGSASVDLGTIAVDTVSLGAALHFYHGWPRVRLRIGAGLRGGLAQLRGEPAQGALAAGDTFLGAWLGPAGILGGTFALSRRIFLEASTEGGYVVLPVTGQAGGAPAAAIAGPFWGTQLGVGFFP